MADQRSKKFFVGNNTFDEKLVGFKADASVVGVATDIVKVPAFLLETRLDSGKVIEGNSNAGHEYGVSSFSEADRMALLEYLKSI